MYYKLKTIYLSHFRLRILLNTFVSGYFAYLFYLKGFDKYPLYMLTILFKLVGYGISIAIERLSFQERHFYYRNMQLGYKKVFGIFFAMDLVLTLLIFFFTHLWSTYFG